MNVYGFGRLDKTTLFRYMGYVVRVYESGYRIYKEEYTADNRNCHMIFIIEISSLKRDVFKIINSLVALDKRRVEFLTKLEEEENEYLD